MANETEAQDIDAITTISLKMSAKNKLATYGNKGDSYEDIIKKLMSIADKFVEVSSVCGQVATN
jgi:hypothetical protein